MTGMTDARRALDKYLSQFPDERLVEYACPHCNTMIGALKPPKHRMFDSLASCPDCGEVHYREIFANGNVHVNTPKEREAADETVGASSEKVAALADEDIYNRAVAFVRETGKVSISALQRHLRKGYNDCARIVERMEYYGVCSSADKSGQRQVLTNLTCKA